MTLSEAQQLISTPFLLTATQQHWADLGCGNGLFSKALLSLLPTGSIVHAIDQTNQSFKESSIKFKKLNFINDPLDLPLLNGILMANSLHYVKDKLSLLGRLRGSMVKDGSFILVEYDMDVSNTWVPYPLLYSTAISLFKQVGFKSFEKIAERQSIFNRAKIYSLHIS